MFRTAITAFAATMLAAVTVGQEPEAAPSDQTLEGIAAIVNDEPISYTDVRQRARFLLLGLGAETPTPEQVEQVTGQALEQLIDEELQLQEAAEYEVEIEADEISAAVDDMARQTGTDRNTLFTQLLAAGINPSSLEEQMRAEIAWRRVMGGLYGSRIRISQNQIEDQLAQIRSSSSKTQYNVSEIFLFAPDDETRAQAVQAATSIVQQLQQGASFQVAAQRLSSAPTAATGGDMGWVTLDAFDDARAEIIAGATPPTLTSPIEVDNGVYILAVRGKAEPQERVSMVELVRLVSTASDDTALLAAVEQSEGCENLDAIAAEDEALSVIPLGRVNTSELGEEGASLVLFTQVGEATDVFAVRDGLAVMFVCDRADNVENIPSREQIEDRLTNQQLGMISERTLRNLRREATIIRR
ncbi:MAG: peptidylprolyl isomerase [Pseudomonadota bacterium]